MKQVLLYLFSGVILITSLISLLPLTACANNAGDPVDTVGNGNRVIIGQISIEGNHHTKSPIIIRELLFHENDTIPEKNLKAVLTSSRQNIFNTRLFNFVSIDTTSTPGVIPKADVHIHVIERWYIWPIPYFEFSDRNFNAWISSMDFSRLTYGIDLTIFNVRGRNETLRFPIHFGFNRLFGVDYTIPYMNRKKTIGGGFGVQLAQNHELIVKSLDNKPVYYKDPNHLLRQNIYSFIEGRLRMGVYSYHTLRISFNAYTFSDSLLRIPGYTYPDRASLNFFALSYQYKNDRRDIAYYPLKGSYLTLMIIKNGFWNTPVNDFNVTLNLYGYWQIYKRWYYAAGTTAKHTFTGAPPYFMQHGLGYGRDYVRGYEYYVIDGSSFALVKNNFKFALVQPQVLDLKFLKSQKFNPIPYAFYLNLYADLGYVYNGDDEQNQYNNLQNSLLVGYGLGIDFATYYDFVLRVELSMNRDGQPGVYLHFTSAL
jgi:outer membrane protein assembly factor BamA